MGQGSKCLGYLAQQGYNVLYSLGALEKQGTGVLTAAPHGNLQGTATVATEIVNWEPLWSCSALSKKSFRLNKKKQLWNFPKQQDISMYLLNVSNV